MVKVSVGRGRRERQRGAAAVEFALLLPLLMTLVMGAMDWGWFFFVHQRVVNAAREGARAGTLLPPAPPEGQVDLAVAEAQDAAEDYLERAQLDRKGVTAEFEAGAAPAIKVTIAYPFSALTGFFSGLGLLPTEAKAVAVMRWQ
jgi:Flp pilus assembly protein TadG